MEIVFERPFFLLFFISLPLLVITHFYFLRNNKRKAMKFYNFEAMKRVTGVTLLTKNLWLLVLRLTILSLLILSISGPVFWIEGKVNHNDYVIAIDSSASMTSDDMLPDRLTAAKEAALRFVEGLDAKTQMSIVTFAGISYINQPLTSDTYLTRQTINKIEFLPAGGTDIGSAIINSVNVLMQGRKSKKIIIITDGTDTAGFAVDDNVGRALEYARKHHVIIYAIGVGTQEGGSGPLPDNLKLSFSYNRDELRRIASGTDGKFFEATDVETLDLAFSDIANDAEMGPVPYELSFGLLALALLFIFVEWGLINTRYRFLP